MSFEKIFPIIVLVVLLAGCIDISSLAAKDCGDDEDCFKEAAATCSPAKLTKTELTSGMSMEIIASILGGTAEKCRVKLRVNKLNIDEAMSDVMPSKMLEMLEEFEGKEMTCTVEASDVSSTSPFEMGGSGDCEGSLLDLLENWGAPVGGSTSLSSSSSSSSSSSGPKFNPPDNKFEWAANLGCGSGSKYDPPVIACLDELYADTPGAMDYDAWLLTREDVAGMETFKKENRYADYLWGVKKETL